MVGGDAGCTHIQTSLKPSAKSTLSGHGDDGRSPYLDTVPGIPYKGTCPRCGAVRVDAQIGQEPLHDCLAWARQEPPCAPPQCWICAMRAVFAEVYRVLVPTGTLWCNVGDAYAGSSMTGGHGKETITGSIQWQQDTMFQASRKTTGLKPKSLMGLPWRLALALQQDGFILRSEIIWHKLNPMPESVQDRPTRAHEQVFLFSKQQKYYFDMEAVREPHADFQRGNAAKHAQYGGHRTHGYEHEEHITRWSIDESQRSYNPNGRACRSVWSLASEPCHFAHFATMPTELVRRCLLAGAPRAVCSACRKPWVRTVERVTATPGQAAGYARDCLARNDGARAGHWVDMQAHTTGFAPSCPCNAPTRPSTILDPFCGSGTTLLVARELGHHGVGLDLSYPYLHDIARERLGLAALHRWTEGAAPRPETHTDLPLFATLDTNTSPLLC